MIKRFKDLQNPIEQLLEIAVRRSRENKAYAALAPAIFTDSEWCMIENTIEILAPFKDALKLCTEESVLSFHRAYYIFEKLLSWMDEQLEAYRDNPNFELNILKTQAEFNAFDKAQTKLQGFYDDKALDEAMLIPLLLDPRYGFQHLAEIWRDHEAWLDGAK